MIVPGMFVCRSFLISMCMFYCVESLCSYRVLTVIVRAGGAIWLNPFATVLFSVWSNPYAPHLTYCPIPAYPSFQPSPNKPTSASSPSKNIFPESVNPSHSTPPMWCSFTSHFLTLLFKKCCALVGHPPPATPRADEKWPQITQETSSHKQILVTKL